MKAKLILPALDEAKSPFWRPIKYSLFPPIGLATLAGHFRTDDDVEIVDQHVESLRLDDSPDLVIIQTYVTNAYRAYRIADHYRSQGCFVALGGLHATSLPEEAAAHADTVFIGPADEAFPRFLEDFRNGRAEREYLSRERQIETIPAVRRDLIKRNKYLVPNSLVVSRGCPHHCDFCYKDGFYSGGKSFYTARLDSVLADIERLPGKHLYFLDDHLFADERFASELFTVMRGMNRLFQGAATVDSILRGKVAEQAAAAGLKSLFVGFETLSKRNLQSANKGQNLKTAYSDAIQKLHSLGISINGSFVFGMDDDDPDVFERTVEWAVKKSITTCTFHIMTPYPGTELFRRLESEGRITTRDWERYTTREAVFTPKRMTAMQLEEGYRSAYRNFYSWKNIVKGSLLSDSEHGGLRHFAYAAGWKKMEPLWNFLIRFNRLDFGTPLLERLLGSNAKDAIVWE